MRGGGQQVSGPRWVAACILALGAEIAGRPGLSVYDGSWTEWGAEDSGCKGNSVSAILSFGWLFYNVLAGDHIVVCIMFMLLGCTLVHVECKTALAYQ